MKFVFDIRQFYAYRGDKTEYPIAELIGETQKVLAKHDLVFVSDREMPPAINNDLKVTIRGPRATNELLSKYWFDIKMKGFLKKERADLFICFNDRFSLKSEIPQVVVFTNDIKVKKGFLKHIKKASAIITSSEVDRKMLIESYSVQEEKIKVMQPAAAKPFMPLNFVEKENIKQQVSEGKEYFLCNAVDNEQSLLNLFKAFSLFKKRQRSEMKLLIHGWVPYAVSDKLKSYKYRDDVFILEEDEPPYPHVLAASYAMIQLETNVQLIPSAFQSGVPMILPSTSTDHEVSRSAALYAQNDNMDLADKMMQIYKDEKLRFEILESGKIHSRRYSISNAASVLCDVIRSEV